jgi:hypothetical protein
VDHDTLRWPLQEHRFMQLVVLALKGQGLVAAQQMRHDLDALAKARQLDHALEPGGGLEPPTFAL